jgi:uncharacterized ParB-like nuclease family protein
LLISDRATETEADGGDPTGTVRWGLQPCNRSEEILRHLGPIELGEKLQAFFDVAGIAADRREAIRRERHEVGNRQPPGDVLDIKIAGRTN